MSTHILQLVTNEGISVSTQLVKHVNHVLLDCRSFGVYGLKVDSMLTEK